MNPRLISTDIVEGRAESRECLMLTESLNPCDGASLARLVRAVGLSARRSLNRPANFSETRELLRAIQSLESAMDRRASGDLSRWVSSLRRRVEEHLVAAE